MPDSGTPAEPGDDPEAAPSPAGGHAGNDVLTALSSCLSAWQQAGSWEDFMEPLASVRAAAMQAGHLALHDVCLLLLDSLVQLSETQQRPDDEQCAVLATWPSFAIAWAESPGESRLGELLVEFLKHPMWPQPLAPNEAENLSVMLGVESGEHGSESLIQATIESMDATKCAAADADASGGGGLPGYDGLSGYAKVGTMTGGGGNIVPDVRARMTGGIDIDEVEDLSAGMDLGAYGVADEMDTPAGRHMVDDPDRPEAEFPEHDVAELPELAHEMIHLLIMEASQIATALADIMPLATSETTPENERREALEHFAEQVERFNGAVELLGLEGLWRAGQQFHQNIIKLSAGGDALTPEVAELLVTMCTAVPEYLEHPADRSAGGALTSLLAHPAWPQPAQAQWAVEVDTLLASPVVETEEEEGEKRAVRALPDDVSLELPGDVDIEVLDGLLQDLPGQTAEFSRSVEALVSGGAPDDVEVAQRIAHTVKGAANTVGVAGLANLTHHLEDILLALGKHGGMPGRGLREMLVRAADCLESMGEALLGQGAPPVDALDTLQGVLDWANTIDDEGVAAVTGGALAAAPGVEAEREAQDAQSSPTPVTATSMVRVPAPLVDDLLRLVGETIILTGQIQERLDVTAREAQNMRRQYMLVQQLGQEMEELIDLQDLSLPQQRVVRGETFDALEFDQYNELHTCSRRLVEAATDTREVGQNIEEHLSALSDMLSDQSRLNRENQEAVLKTRMVAVQTIVPRLQRSVRQASRLTGKNVELHCIGSDTLMDTSSPMGANATSIRRSAADREYRSALSIRLARVCCTAS